MKTIRRLSFALAAVVLAAAAVAAMNEIAQCWAVTKSGTRCKRRAAPETRYCRQHTADRTPDRQPDRCRSMTTNGVWCAEKPMPGRNYCPQHQK